MIMPPRLRKAVLTAHVATSVGWLGAVLAYLVLDVTAVTADDFETVRAAYVGMSLIIGTAIVPLALASILIGLVNALGTPWGLVRHYWVLVKLLLTLFATAILLIETRTVQGLAETASVLADPTILPGTLPHSIGGAVVLLLTAVIAVHKPRGLTRCGWRRQNNHHSLQGKGEEQ